MKNVHELIQWIHYLLCYQHNKYSIAKSQSLKRPSTSVKAHLARPRTSGTLLCRCSLVWWNYFITFILTYTRKFTIRFSKSNYTKWHTNQDIPIILQPSCSYFCSPVYSEIIVNKLYSLISFYIICQISHSTGSERLFWNHHAHPLRPARSYRLRCVTEVSVWFKSRLNPWYISIQSNPNLYSTKIVMKMRWQIIATNVSMVSPSW